MPDNIPIFDVVNDISNNKKGVLQTPIVGGDDYVLVDEFYNKAALNKALLKHPNCIRQLNEVNIRELDPALHHDYLLWTIPKQIRKGKWSKSHTNEKLQVISDYYKVDLRTASRYATFVTDTELASFKTQLSERKKFKI